MSGKMGSRATAKKPTTVRRQSAKASGAFGKETGEQVLSGEVTQNVDKASRGARVKSSGQGG